MLLEINCRPMCTVQELIFNPVVSSESDLLDPL